VTDQRVRLVLGIDVIVPDNDVSLVRARVSGVSQDTGEALGPETVARAEIVVDRLLEVLRATGFGADGPVTTSASAVSTRVRCTLPIGPRPAPVRVNTRSSSADPSGK
jgi:hypothetical protein